MSVYLYSHNTKSQSARLLARAMGIKMIKHHNSKFRPNHRKTIINWGVGKHFPGRVFNTPEDASKAVNKLTTLELMKEAGVSVPLFTTDFNWAFKWHTEGKTVVCRHLLNASEGRGIDILEPHHNIIPQAPLYVQYIPKKAEYRVHVVRDEVIDVQQKIRRRDYVARDNNWHVRNHDNGFIFVRNGINVPNMVNEEAIKAVKALGLDFGGVDVIWNDKKQMAYVLEVNTAPGIEGTTVVKYKEALERLINNEMRNM